MADERKERVSDDGLQAAVDFVECAGVDANLPLMVDLILDLRDCRAERDKLRARVEELDGRVMELERDYECACAEGADTFVGKLLVRDGVPYRHGRCQELVEKHPIRFVEHDYRVYLALTDSPADLPYKLAWGNTASGAGWPEPSGYPPDSLYDVWRVGVCEHEHCWHGWLKEVNPGSSGIIEHGICPTCHGDGGRYELRPADKGDNHD